MQTYQKLLRWVLLGGLSLVPFISFIVAGGIVPDMFFPFITGKNFVFRVLIELLLAAYIVLAIREPKYRPKMSLLMWAALAFVAWMGVATLFSVDPIKSFWSNFERMEGYVGLLHLLVLFIIGGAVLTAEKWWDKFFRISISASAIMGLYALLQVFGALAISTQSGNRVDTTFGNATYLAVFMLIHIFITLFMLAREYRHTGLRWFYSFALLLQGFGLFFTETRGALLGVVGGLIVAALYIAWAARGDEWASLRRGALWALGSIGILVVMFFAVKDMAFIQEMPGLGRLASISLNDPTTQSRLFYIWPMAIEGALERPLTGWGQENFSYIFNEHYNPAMYAQEQWFDRAHNQFLDWFVAGGAPAGLLYLSLFVLAAWAFFRSHELAVPEAAALLGLLAAYAFNNLFVFDNLMSAVYFFLILAYAHTLSRKALPRFMVLSKPASEHTVAIVAPVVAVVVIGGALMFNAQPIARAQTIIDALQGGTVEARLALFEKALTQGTLGKQEVVEQLFQFASGSVAPSTSVEPAVKQEVYTVTRSAGEQLLAERVDDARLELFMGAFLTQFRNYDEALAHLSRAQELSPRKQQIAFRLGLLYLQQGETQKALATFKAAFELAPAYEEARVFYASALYYAGQSAEADTLLTERFGTVLVDNDQLLLAYSNTKQYDRVIGVLKGRVDKDPENLQRYLDLAGGYLASGDKERAISTLKEVARRDPAKAAQVQQFIAQIQSGAL